MTSLKRKILDPSVIALVAAVIMLVAIFLPYAAARPEFRKVIEMLPEDTCIEDTDITLRSTLRVSMVEFLKIYNSTEGGKALAKTCGSFVIAMGVAAVLVGLFAVLRKAVPMLFCGVLAFAAFYLHNGNYGDRQVVPGWEYRFGIGYYLFATAAIVVIAAGVWMLRVNKKPQSTEKPQSEPQQ